MTGPFSVGSVLVAVPEYVARVYVNGLPSAPTQLAVRRLETVVAVNVAETPLIECDRVACATARPEKTRAATPAASRTMRFMVAPIDRGSREDVQTGRDERSLAADGKRPFERA